MNQNNVKLLWFYSIMSRIHVINSFGTWVLWSAKNHRKMITQPVKINGRNEVFLETSEKRRTSDSYKGPILTFARVRPAKLIEMDSGIGNELKLQFECWPREVFLRRRLKHLFFTLSNSPFEKIQNYALSYIMLQKLF